MRFSSVKLAGVIAIISASFFLGASPSLSSNNDIIAFGNLGSYSNPANLDPDKTASASGRFYNITDNNAIPALNIYSDLAGPYFEGAEGFANIDQNYEFFFAVGNIGFGYLLEEEKDYLATGDTVRAIQDIMNNSHTVGKSYDIGMTGTEKKTESFKFFNSQKIELGLVDDLRIGACFKLINGIYFQKGELSGIASQEDPSTIGFNFDVDSYYQKEDTSGNGFGLDLGASCKINDKLSLEVLLENVFGQIDWRNVNRMTATGNSENIEVDPGGEIVNKPTISGYKSVESFQERLLYRSIWGLTYKQTENVSLIGILEPYMERSYYFLGAEWGLYKNLALSLGYGSKYDSASAGIHWEVAKFLLYANNMSLSEARSMGALFELSL